MGDSIISSMDAALTRRPGDADQLWCWLDTELGLRIPRRSVCAQHAAPFDYLAAAFFEEFSDAAVWANRGGGKTFLGAVITLLDLLFKPGISIRILGGSLDQSRKMHRYLLGLLLPRFANLLASSPETGPRRSSVGSRHIRLASGSEVEILAQSERSVRGNRVQKMRCDEVELFDPEVWDSAQLTTQSLQPGDQAAGIRDQKGPEPAVSSPSPDACTLNPSPFVRGAVEAFSTLHRPHGLMHQVVDRTRASGSPVFCWCILDVLERCPPARDCGGCALAPDCNGLARNSAGFVRIDDAIAARRRVSRATWEAEMLCLRPSRRGAVFPGFSRERHVCPLEYHSEWPTYRAIDFGFVNPFVCLWMQVSPAGQVRVLREYLQSRVTLAGHARRIRELDFGPVRATFCDPAGGQHDQITGTTARAELAAAGIKTRTRPSSIVAGIETIRRYLEADTMQYGETNPAPASARRGAGASLLIDPACECLIAALEAYHYDDSHRETPVKDGVYDHPIDALRYFFVNHVIGDGKVAERTY